MKVLVNATTLVVGGGIQIGVSFIEQALKNEKFSWFFLVSSGIFKNLDNEIKNKVNVVCVESTPAKIFSGRKSRQLIKKHVKEFKPHLIYSIGFPSYINFSVVELGRYTNPWEINNKPLPWKIIKGPINKLKTRLGIAYRLCWARNADYIETQTVAASQGIFKRAKFPLEKIFVVPNSPFSIFLKEGKKINIDNSFKKETLAFCLSAPYEHKNLDLIPEVAKELKYSYNVKMKFVLTLPFDSEIWIDIKNKSIDLKVSELVENVGKLKIKDCIIHYKRAKIVFLPTLLEVFSATYVEAMSMKIPIVTTDLCFARDNCKTGALFFEPGNAKDAALKIFSLIGDENKYINLIREGNKVLNSYPTTEEKYEKVFHSFKTIIQNETK
jgi:glycosyltransferase involved in cell wall biosynthesis